MRRRVPAADDAAADGPYGDHMTSSAYAAPAPAAAHRPARSPAPYWIGGTIAAVGALIAVSAVAIIAVFGTDGRISSGRHDISTPTAALVSTTAKIDGSSDVSDVLGATSVRIAADTQSGHGVFVGVGRAADVARYLAGAPVATVTDIDHGALGLDSKFALDTKTRPGTATPAAP